MVNMSVIWQSGVEVNRELEQEKREAKVVTTSACHQRDKVAG